MFPFLSLSALTAQQVRVVCVYSDGSKYNAHHKLMIITNDAELHRWRTKTRKPITDVSKSLNWLPVNLPVSFKFSFLPAGPRSSLRSHSLKVDVGGFLASHLLYQICSSAFRRLDSVASVSIFFFLLLQYFLSCIKTVNT